jgi:hypothetical protein
MSKHELMEDSEFEDIRNYPHYDENGLCDDCVEYNSMTRKPVRRVDGDGLSFCEKHWVNVTQSFYGTGEFYEPFPIQ